MRFIVQDAQGDQVTLQIPHTNYRNTFRLAASGVALQPGAALRGTILATARKVEAVSDGGNYVEPLFGRPRRMQGEIIAADAAKNELSVEVGYPVTVRLPDTQKVAEFAVGGRVGWDNAELPTFEMRR